MTFKKGASGNPNGRPKGEPNKLTTEVKAMIEGALHDLGGKDYLIKLGKEQPAVFAGLVGRIIPKDVNATVQGQMDVRAWLMSLGEPEK